jgi:hypothetical protein
MLDFNGMGARKPRGKTLSPTGKQQALVLHRRPRNHAELLSFVAHYGAHVATSTTKCSLEDVALRAVRASRRDTALARMMPVFLWRVRERLDLRKLTTAALLKGHAAPLGYFLELASKLGGPLTTFDSALPALRAHAHPDSPTYFFPHTSRGPLESMAVDQMTPADARRWGLLTGTPTDSFETHFRKVAHL